MGQKVHPIGIRLGIVKDHTSVWYADSKNYSKQLITDLAVREYIEKALEQASVSRVVIERPAQTARITIHTARPGIVIGKKGEDVDKLRKPDLDAKLVAQNVAQQLERRVMFRRAMKRVVQNAMRQGAEGIKVQVGGRLGGAEIARSEWYREGRVPLHTLRADIDYATYEAVTTYGIIGVKVWIFKGEVIGDQEQADGAKKTATNEGLRRCFNQSVQNFARRKRAVTAVWPIVAARLVLASSVLKRLDVADLPLARLRQLVVR